MDTDYKAQFREPNDLNWAQFKAELRAVEARLRQEMADSKVELLKWVFFIYWTGSVVFLGGLIIALSERH